MLILSDSHQGALWVPKWTVSATPLRHCVLTIRLGRGRRHCGCGVLAGIAHGQHFPDMPIGIRPVKIASPQPGIELQIVRAARGATVGDARGAHPRKYAVKFRVARMEAVVVAGKRVALRGISVKRDNLVSAMYSTGLNSTTSLVTPQRTDRHGILDQKPPDFQLLS